MNLLPIYLLLRLMLFGDNLIAGQLQTQVWLTVSPLANETTQRNIEIHWRNAPKPNQNDWIGLFTKDPIDSSGAIKTIDVNSRTDGNSLTDVQFPYWNFATGKLSQQCLGYFVAYIRNNHVLAKNCIKNNPFWMEHSLSVIGERTLPSIMIPGTHDAGSYEKWTKDSSSSFLDLFVVTQDESIYNQLVYGIRYLDMRIGYYNVSGSDDKFWIVHDVFRRDLTLRSVAQQVKDFLMAAPKEIVILDFHRFVNGFIDEKNADILKTRFKEFFEVISSQLGDLMIPFSLGYGVKVNELIGQNKRVLIGFQMEQRKYLVNQYLWPNVRHQWADKDELAPLVHYFEDTLCSDNQFTLRSAMAEMTPTTQGVLSMKYKSLRALAQTTNSLFMDWFSDRWPHCTNIVAADYFLSSNVVDIALSVNYRKHIKQKQNRFHGFH